MGIFQLTGNLDTRFGNLDDGEVAKAGPMTKFLSALSDLETVSDSFVPIMLTEPTSTYVRLFLEDEVSWYAIDEDLKVVGRYASEAEAIEAGSTFVRRTPFNDFFALYDSMNANGDFQIIEDQFEDSLREHASLTQALSEDATFFVDLCVYGQISMESAWDTTDAKGLWQITEIMMLDLVERYDDYESTDDIDRRDPVQSTAAVVDYYARMYNWFGSKCERVAEHYNLSPREFLIPCLIDAYHCGPAKMSAILDMFLEMIDEGLFEDLEGQQVYNQMSRMYFEDGEDPNYIQHHREYFYRAQAVAGLMILKMAGYDVAQFTDDLSIQ